jgi:hypothetical protein
MWWIIGGVLAVAACSGSPKPVPTARGSASTHDAGVCNCAATCDCHGDDDPARDEAANRAGRICAAAGVTCPACGACLAP